MENDPIIIQDGDSAPAGPRPIIGLGRCRSSRSSICLPLAVRIALVAFVALDFAIFGYVALHYGPKGDNAHSMYVTHLVWLSIAIAYIPIIVALALKRRRISVGQYGPS